MLGWHIYGVRQYNPPKQYKTNPYKEAYRQREEASLGNIFTYIIDIISHSINYL